MPAFFITIIQEASEGFRGVILGVSGDFQERPRGVQEVFKMFDGSSRVSGSSHRVFQVNLGGFRRIPRVSGS